MIAASYSDAPFLADFLIDGKVDEGLDVQFVLLWS